MPMTPRQRMAIAAKKRVQPALFTFTRPPLPTSILEGFAAPHPTLTQLHLGLPAGPPYRADDFQAIGASWLIEHPTGVLCDDMGLGKCRMTLDAIMHLRTPGLYLIVCEASNVDTWMDEWAKWYPDVRTYAHRGTKRAEGFQFFTQIFGVFDVNVVIVSYATFRNDCELLTARPYKWAVLDEGQAIRSNPLNGNQSKIAEVVHGIIAPRRHIVTGTPISKTPADCWNLMRWLHIENMDWREFAAHCLNIKEVRLTQYSSLNMIESYTPFGTAHLRNTLTSNMIRRTKEDVLNLPPMRKHSVDVRMNATEAHEYKQFDAMYKHALGQLAALGDPDDSEDPKPGPLISPRAIQMEMLQFCMNISAKFEKTTQLIQEALDAERKVIVFCTRMSTLRLLYTLVEKMTKRNKFEFTYIHGGVLTTAKQGERSERQQHVDAFQNDPNCKVLIATQQSCRVGLTLTAASVIVRLAREWNPDQNTQAEARIDRAGQTSIMDVYDLYAVLPNGTATIEHTHVDSALAKKNRDAQSIIKDRRGHTESD